MIISAIRRGSPVRGAPRDRSRLAEDHMRRFATAASIFAAFLAGCVAARAVIPVARAGTTPQRWEYHCETLGLGTMRGFTETLNQAGVEGWELAGLTTQYYCFKRPLP
jgi:hypothetical protein